MGGLGDVIDCTVLLYILTFVWFFNLYETLLVLQCHWKALGIEDFIN